MGARMTQELAINALKRAIQHRRPAPGLIHHSDRVASTALKRIAPFSRKTAWWLPCRERAIAMITPPSRASGAASKMKWSTTNASRLGHRLNQLFGNTSRFFTIANAGIHGLVIWLPLCSHSPSHGWPLEVGLSTIVRTPQCALQTESITASIATSPTRKPFKRNYLMIEFA